MNIIKNIGDIKSGANTHNHGKDITLVRFKTNKIMVNIMVGLM